MTTTVPKSLESGVVFGVFFFKLILFCMKNTVPKSGLKRSGLWCDFYIYFL